MSVRNQGGTAIASSLFGLFLVHSWALAQPPERAKGESTNAWENLSGVHAEPLHADSTIDHSASPAPLNAARGAVRIESVVGTDARGQSAGPSAQAEPSTLYNVTGLCHGDPGPATYRVCLSITVTNPVGHRHNAGLPPIEILDPVCQAGIPINQQTAWRVRTPAFAARMHVVWQFSGACNVPDQQDWDSGEAGMVELGAGQGYELIGATPNHPWNHFGTQRALDGARAIAADYAREFPGDPALGINDMSLPWGGLFDIDSNWARPHSTHRFGDNVDIRLWSVPEAHRERLQQLFIQRGARWIIEGRVAHYHLDFAPPASLHYEETLSCE